MASVYKHMDGNPENLLPWLRSFNERFVAERGDDDVYKLAQLLRSSERENMGGDEFLGWGLVPQGENFGEKYAYRLMKDGSVTYKKREL